MSHIVTIQTQVRDPAAIERACERLQLPPPQTGTHRLFTNEATGLAVQLVGWRFTRWSAKSTPANSSSITSAVAGASCATGRFSANVRGRKNQTRSETPRAYRPGTTASGRLDQTHGPTRRRCGMTKSIEIIVAANGETKLETKGFSVDCRTASQALEQSFGYERKNRSRLSSTSRCARRNSNMPIVRPSVTIFTVKLRTPLDWSFFFSGAQHACRSFT